MLKPSNPYFQQVELLLALMPLVGRERCFALKGGSGQQSICTRSAPLVGGPGPDLCPDQKSRAKPCRDRRGAGPHRKHREPGHAGCQAFNAVRGRRVNRQGAGGARRGRRKVEASPVLRGAVGPIEVRGVCPTVEHHFGYVEMPLMHPHDLYAGKLSRLWTDDIRGSIRCEAVAG